ncbi:Gp138 family membrane-puncturing spike protein [Candidatus Pantoea multigeneris]|uniref:Phage protein Gp138 N-terminal domain-containing protein n=1 Tax=Candidatus Pantoea multigeneris TaxID=2608357 RepID=A0ABX0R7D2_9GAMM|nr:Gp138 family membrane-puncturing spike protein [Pantoea multigeneris]NIF20252.1 hypothetical protein [Pantoea multigeneris]
MAVTPQSLAGGEQETLKSIIGSALAAIRVAMPGIIQSFDPGDDSTPPTCTVQPAIKGQVSDDQGNYTSAPLPLLVDVPVVFQRGGGCSLTFPISEGDECLLVFSDRCIDFWWQSGGVQEAVDDRMHDLSDAFAIVGLQSGATKIGGISTTAVELRSDDGETKLSLSPGDGTISGTAPGGFNLNGLKILSDGRLQLVDGSIVDKHNHGGVQYGGSNTAPLGG